MFVHITLGQWRPTVFIQMTEKVWEALKERGLTLTSRIDTAGGGATSEWLWVAGSRSGDRPRPPATPRCQTAAGDRAPAHLLTSASVFQSLNQRKVKVQRSDDLRVYFSSLQCVCVCVFTCLETSSVASCHSELVAPLCVAHVWHKSVVQSITWEKHTHVEHDLNSRTIWNTNTQSRKESRIFKYSSPGISKSDHFWGEPLKLWTSCRKSLLLDMMSSSQPSSV